jgi:hypothetical protein
MTPSARHPVEDLFDELAGFDYPEGVIPAPKRIPGTSFDRIRMRALA